MEWTKRRPQKHILVLCRIDLLLTNGSNGNGNGNDNGYDFILSTTTSHFDWFSCIDQTVRAKKENLLNSNISTDMTAVTVKLDEVFTTYTDFFNTTKEWSQDELLSHISSSFETYQNKLWNIHVDYRVNMFDSSDSDTFGAGGANNDSSTPVRISDEDNCTGIQLSRRQPIKIDSNLVPNNRLHRRINEKK